MHTMKKFLSRHALGIGIFLMFLLTWPIDLANSGILPIQVPFFIYITLGYGFIFASTIMTGLSLGKDGVLTLFKRFLIWRVNWKWYLVALLLYPTIFLSAVWINALLTQTAIDFSTVMAYSIFGVSVNLPLFVIPFFVFDAITNGEEMGWRGYVLPRLQAKYSALTSSLILGFVWGIWHLPKFMGTDSMRSFPWFVVGIMAEAVLYTWLYNNTKGSLLLVTIFHAAGNTAGMFLPIANTISDQNMNVRLIVILIEILAGIFVTLSAGSERLSRTEQVQV